MVVLQLHTARKEDPITPQTHLGASISLNTTQIPPKYPPDISKEVKMSTDNIMPHTDTSRHTQTAPDSVRGCLGVSLYVCWRLFSSVDFLSSLEMSGGCFGDVWVVSGGIWVVFMETKGTQRCFRSIRDSSPYKMEPWHYFGTALKHITFFARPYWGIKISKCLYIRFTKIIGL